MQSIIHFFTSPALCSSNVKLIFDPLDISNNCLVNDIRPQTLINSDLENFVDISNNSVDKIYILQDAIIDEENKIKKTLEETTKKVQQIKKIFSFKTINKSFTEIKEDVYQKLEEDFIDPLFAKNIVSEDIDTSSGEILPSKMEENSFFHEEIQYLNLIREIVKTGSYEKSRNGNTYTKFGYTMKYSLRNGLIPMITTKKMAWKSCFEELFWFIRGSTSSLELQARNVSIWNGNGSREFLDSRGLYHLSEGDLGPIYGYQWRHYNAEYTNSKSCYQGEGIDQLKQIIDELSNPETRSSRRLIMTAWNPCQISQMALPPCHVMAQFHVRDNKYLSCALFQRSGDVGLGIPFNIASYSLLTHILAKHCGLEAEEFVHFLGNCHIYEEHVGALQTQQEREPMIFPRIEISKKDTIEEYCLDDISWITPYHSHPSIKMEMKA
jgi:thymidylate synthase